AALSLRKYGPIASAEQRQRYVDDFNAEFQEYRRLRALLDSVNSKFSSYSVQWKLLSPGSEEHEVRKETGVK
ncbi:ELL factor, partial [Rhinopomastus cyanomelas]|nr:ELL factor [Rhinopomastus cyanomelas]